MDYAAVRSINLQPTPGTDIIFATRTLNPHLEQLFKSRETQVRAAGGDDVRLAKRTILYYTN